MDRYILSRFLYNFLSSFAILMVIFIFQTVWLFIDDLAGKDLDLAIIGKFLYYYMPTLIDKVLPLTVLLSSILTFGNFAENYEFAAMKASGISLQRAMRSIIVFVLLLGIGTFFLANNVIPIAEQKIFNLRKNIAKVKPAAVIVEGVFSDIEGTEMNMKVAKKSGENDRFLEDVIIHQKSQTKLNTTVIKAKTGELISSEDSDIIQLVLNDGHYYEEVQSKSSKDQKKQPFTRAEFETYIKNIDISALNNQDIEKESDIVTDKMKNVGRLYKDIDSLKENNLVRVRAFSNSISIRVGAFPLKVVDSGKTKTITPTGITEIPDEAAPIDEALFEQDIASLVPEWQKGQLLINARNNITNILNTVRSRKIELNRRYEIYYRHILSMHKKFAFALSCIILFFVGAPLGAIIRKGGLGLPMVIAILLFLTYHFLGVFADNYAKKGAWNPILGAWLPTMVTLPMGIFLTKRATADRGLMSLGNFFDRVGSLFKKKKKETATTEN
ncbi:LptF/LptG family permease [Flagellimonas sp. DF-77]|uniref:LptF/LptG family permease n=1 Tax=Flagellimonas algarum TaxID=3230298 RepID=UPI00339A7809